jgi:hypothetical protein
MIIRLVTLVIIGVVSAVAWRVEIEYHGWVGLQWLSYFHWAIPFGLILFVSWAVFLSGARFKYSRLLVIRTTLLAAVIGSMLVGGCLRFLFVSGPSAFIALGEMSHLSIWILRLLCVLILSSIPALIGLLARGLGSSVSSMCLAAATFLWLGAPVLGLLMLWMVSGGQLDLIHTIKSGTVIPWLVISLGLLFLCNGKVDH